MEYNSYRIICITTTPILLGLLSQNLLNVVDSIFIGHIGELELGATVIASTFYLCVYTIGLGYSVGVQILIAQNNGKKDYKSIESIFHSGVILSVIGSVLFVTITYLFGKDIIGLTINSTKILNLTLQYIDYRIYGIFFAFPALVFRSFYIAINHNKIILYNSIIITTSNILLNYILINGKLGFTSLGLTGAAIASVISEAIGLLHFYICTTKNQIIYNHNRKVELNLIICKRILNISIGSMVQNFLNICTWFFFFIAIEHLNERSLSISNIVRSISTLLFISINAFAYTTNAYTSNLVGSKQYHLIMPVAIKICCLSLFLILPILITIYIFPDAIISIYTPNPELIKETIPSLIIFSACCIIAVPASIVLNIILGLGHTKIASLIQLITSIFYVFYIGYFIMYKKIDVSLSWFCEYIYWICILMCSIIYLKFHRIIMV